MNNISPVKNREKPCKSCPWRRDSARGWLGGVMSPEQFVRLSESDEIIPCHTDADVENVGWLASAGKVSQCAGRSIHFANRCKRSRNPEVAVLPKDVEAVFQWPAEFIEHHTLRGSHEDHL